MVSVRSELLVLSAELGRRGRPLPLVSLLLVEGGDGGHRHAGLAALLPCRRRHCGDGVLLVLQGVGSQLVSSGCQGRQGGVDVLGQEHPYVRRQLPQEQEPEEAGPQVAGGTELAQLRQNI